MTRTEAREWDAWAPKGTSPRNVCLGRSAEWTVGDLGGRSKFQAIQGEGLVRQYEHEGYYAELHEELLKRKK